MCEADGERGGGVGIERVIAGSCVKPKSVTVKNWLYIRERGWEGGGSGDRVGQLRPDGYAVQTDDTFKRYSLRRYEGPSTASCFRRGTSRKIGRGHT